jgi:acetyl esterase/lipase
MKRLFFFITLLFILIPSLSAQQVIRLWPGNPPTDNGITVVEQIDKNAFISNVSIPFLTVYLPKKEIANGKAVVICPGGGYAGVSINNEGYLFAQWLNTQGIAGIVLKYRMPNGHKEVPLDDAQQAIRYVRKHAQEWGINPHGVGISGFSAGGHLASTASTHFTTDGISTRPDFSILFYPVITMNKETTHQGSLNNLLGDNPALADVDYYSNEKQVNSQTPPAIIFLSDDDKTVSPVNSIYYYEALKKNKVNASLHIFPVGGHGWGMKTTFKYHQQVLDLLSDWLKNYTNF